MLFRATFHHSLMIVRLWWVKNTGHFPQVRVQVTIDATDKKKGPKVSPCPNLSYKIIINF